MARNLIILSDPPYGTERSYNGLRHAARHGAEIGVCGTCMDARGITEAELAEGSRPSTLDQLADWTSWAAKALVF